MKQFTHLYRELESSTKTSVKLRALVDFLKSAPQEDKLWAIGLFSHRRPRRIVPSAKLREWAAEVSDIPEWLFEESYHIVGDLAETISLTLPNAIETSSKTLSDYAHEIVQLKGEDESVKKEYILESWQGLNKDERFLFNKLITGGFRIGIAQKMITKALAKVLDEDENKIAHRLMGDWSPLTTTYKELLENADWQSDISKPYPFFLAYALEGEVSNLGNIEEWQAEWKWDGIRSQFIKREGEIFIWSRGEELVTDKYPEFAPLSKATPDNWVIDGELLVYKDGQIRPFNELQKRIGRKTISKKALSEYPCVIFAYDLLEYNGEDIRESPLKERQHLLSGLVKELHQDTPNLVFLSEPLECGSWEKLEEQRLSARSLKAEGLMLKAKNGIYKSGRRRGEWWKWKLDPYTIDAVMLYAQRGHGRRSNLYTDYTFAVWDGGGKLVPFAKAYSGLTDKDFAEVTSFVNKNTIERFGPVRSVKPELVFELAFEGINLSTRHKSGVALRFPRMKRWRRDKPAEEANTLEDLKALLENQ